MEALGNYGNQYKREEKSLVVRYSLSLRTELGYMAFAFSLSMNPLIMVCGKKFRFNLAKMRPTKMIPLI